MALLDEATERPQDICLIVDAMDVTRREKLVPLLRRLDMMTAVPESTAPAT